MSGEPGSGARRLAAEWLRRARSDLTVADLADDERLAPEILAFHAQQAAEKALKACLVLRQIDFPRTHSIGLLVGLCRSAGFDFPESLGEAVTLTRYAVASRYPGDEDVPTRQDAREAASLASRILTWAEACLPE